MIYVVVALAAEARPLISHFRLEKTDKLESLTLYRRSDLVMAAGGVGKDAMAVSVEALAKAIPDAEPSVWINLGVGGHRVHEIGTAILAQRVVDEDTGSVFELSPPTDVHMQMGEIRTVEHVETQYETEAVYEMEAAAFCKQTGDLTDRELIQVLKIVSDNRRTGTLCVSARQVQGLVEQNLPTIDLLVSTLHRNARQLSS